MKSTAVICGSSSSFAFAMYVSLWSFLKNSPKLAAQADIYVYAYQWSEEIKQKIRSLGPITILDFDIPADIERTEHILRFTPALFHRFEAFKLLDKYETVICLDSDILVKKELLETISKQQKPIGLTPDTMPIVRRNFKSDIPGYDMSAPCYNAGFIVLKKQGFPANSGEIYSWLYDMLKKYSYTACLGDQGLINLALQEFKLQPEVYSMLYNQPASSSAKQLKKAFIIHSTGHRKFWCYYFFKEWVEGYAKWREIGGPAVGVRKESPRWQNWRKNKKGIFWELAPDASKYPAKFLLFAIKYFIYMR